jgi:uncharacterized membrane protein (UPF0127 family)
MKKILLLNICFIIFFCSFKNYCFLEINGKILRVEIADTEKKRIKGLMNRKKLEENEGMLFIFEKPAILNFWMKDTSIPLSIAFINENLEIIQIEDMLPYDVINIHTSISPAKYALEVNKGWFEKNNIKIGDKIKIIKSGN